MHVFREKNNNQSNERDEKRSLVKSSRANLYIYD